MLKDITFTEFLKDQQPYLDEVLELDITGSLSSELERVKRLFLIDCDIRILTTLKKMNDLNPSNKELKELFIKQYHKDISKAGLMIERKEYERGKYKKKDEEEDVKHIDKGLNYLKAKAAACKYYKFHLPNTATALECLLLIKDFQTEIRNQNNG